MKYDFDEFVERRGTWSMKYDISGHGKPLDVIPLWVADMDFRSPPCVNDAMVRFASKSIFGYSVTDDRYFESLYNWFSKRFSWTIKPEWLITSPGVVNAIQTAIRGLTEPGDAVIIQEPVYYPFSWAIKLTDRKPVVSELKNDGTGRYTIDFDDFEYKIKTRKVKMFILCSPHNPIGRVWTEEELIRMGDICLRYGVTVIADEIHQDIVFPGYDQLVFAGLSEKFADITITCTAPSKTFNMAGLNMSNIFISNKKLREGFNKEHERAGLPEPGIMGIVACKAAYDGGEPWLEELIPYLDDNMSMIESAAKDWGGAVFHRPEATYLAWINFTALHLTDEDLNSFMLNQAKLWLNEGYIFGAGGSGFMRINAATSHGLLEEALMRLTEALN